jgi:hypothetical protein
VNVVAILAIPSDDDASGGVGLMAPTVLGGRLPLAYAGDRNRGWQEDPTWHGHGLALFWDGQFVPEGWDRFRRVVGEQFGGLHRHAQMLCGRSTPNMSEALTVARAAAERGIIARVVCLARVDGRNVEV